MWRRAGERELRKAWGWRGTGDARRERREGGSEISKRAGSGREIQKGKCLLIFLLLVMLSTT